MSRLLGTFRGPLAAVLLWPEFAAPTLAALALPGLLSPSMAIAAEPAQAQGQDQTWTVNYRDTELEEVVRFVAQVTGKTIIVDPKAKGRVQVISSQPLNKDQLYDLFLSILDVNGFAAVDSGDTVRIIPARDARSSAAPVVSGKQRENSEIVTEVIQLKNIAAPTLIPVLRPLAPQQAHMAAYGPSNAIVISDTAANIARIRAVIDRIDRSAVGDTVVVRLEHASAEEVVRMLEQLEKGEPGAKGQGEGANKGMVLVADKRTNSVLVSGDDMQRQRARALIAHLDGPMAQSGNVKVYYLQYANAKDLATTLNKVMQNVAQMAPGASGGAAAAPAAAAASNKATIEADEGTNALIVTANAEVMTALQAVIERLDIRRAQVLVEAIIVEMSANKNRDLGIQWMFAASGGGYGSSSRGATGGGALLGATTNAALGATGEDSSDDPRIGLGTALAATNGQVFGIGRLSDNFSFNAVLNALQENIDANILSTPSLLTLDNEEASIIVGQNVPFKTGSYTSTGNATSVSSPFQTIQRNNVGLTLKVTPHINEGDSLVLEISQEVSSLSGAASLVDASDVITNERKIESKVMADNGQIIVLGGLIKDDVQETTQKVPLLGDIPMVGRLFRSNSSQKTKTNLMVFLRPIIVREGRILTGATGEKYKYIRGEQMQIRDRGDDFFNKKDLPLLPEWEEQLQKLEELKDLRQGGVINLQQQPVSSASQAQPQAEPQAAPAAPDQSVAPDPSAAAPAPTPGFPGVAGGPAVDAAAAAPGAMP